MAVLEVVGNVRVEGNMCINGNLEVFNGDIIIRNGKIVVQGNENNTMLIPTRQGDFESYVQNLKKDPVWFINNLIIKLDMQNKKLFVNDIEIKNSLEFGKMFFDEMNSIFIDKNGPNNFDFFNY